MKTMLLCFLLLMSGFCHSHMKWAKAEQMQNGVIKITLSESMIPFVPERNFIVGEIRARDGKTIESVASDVIQRINNNSVTTLILKSRSLFNSILLDPVPIKKRAKIDKNTGRRLPPRVEWSRLSVVLNAASLSKQITPATEFLDAVPVFTDQYTGKVNAKYQIQVYRDGKIARPVNLLIFDATANTFILDYSVNAQGVVEFTPKSAGDYLFQADELIFTPGTTGVTDIAHSHLFASLIFTIEL